MRTKWDAADRGHLQMLVRAEGVNFGKLASGILHRVSDDLSTDVDAMGDASVANAAKATALANAFGSKEAPTHPVVGFVPRLLEREGELKLARLELRAIPRHPLPDFSQGGIYVPTARGGAFGAEASDLARARGPEGSRARAMADAYLPQKADTPTELARAVMSRWLRATEPPKRRAKAEVAPTSGQNLFLLTRGQAALARAVRALAFVCADLQKPRLVEAGAPRLVVEPRLWATERPSEPGRPAGAQPWRSRFVVLVLRRADAGARA